MLEGEKVDALVLIERMGHGWEPDPSNLADFIRFRSFNVKCLSVNNFGRSFADDRTGPLEEIRRRKDLHVSVGVYRRIRLADNRSVLAAATAEDASVGQEHRCGMVTAVNRLGSQQRPSSLGWIPKFGRVDGLPRVEVIEIASLRAPCHKHRAVR